jgi:hypothetical protein
MARRARIVQGSILTRAADHSTRSSQKAATGRETAELDQECQGFVGLSVKAAGFSSTRFHQLKSTNAIASTLE